MNKKKEEKIESIAQNILSTLTDTQILSKSYNEPEFIVPNSVPVGLTILAGKPKSGKSLFALDMACSLANGVRLLGIYDLVQQEVLFLALEDSELRLQKRINRLTEDPQGTGRLHFATECARLDHGFFDHIKNWLAEKPNIKLVVIDTFNRVRKLKRRGTTPYEKDYNEINELKKFADDHKIAILVIHHLRKSEAKDVTDMISGSVGITAAADAILILQKERGSNQATFFATGRDIPDFEIGLTLNPESLCWEISTPTEQLTNERVEVLAVLKKENRPMRLGEIASALNKKNNNVHKLISGLIVAGKVEKISYGIYELKKEPIDNGENESGCDESGESSTIAA